MLYVFQLRDGTFFPRQGQANTGLQAAQLYHVNTYSDGSGCKTSVEPPLPLEHHNPGDFLPVMVMIELL